MNIIKLYNITRPSDESFTNMNRHREVEIVLSKLKNYGFVYLILNTKKT